MSRSDTERLRDAQFHLEILDSPPTCAHRRWSKAELSVAVSGHDRQGPTGGSARRLEVTPVQSQHAIDP